LFLVVVVNNWHLKQLDVNKVFLHRELYKEVYMQILPSKHDNFTNQGCMLNKSLYWLRQANKQWYD